MVDLYATQILADVLEYLNMREISRLDVATCSHKARPNFLSLLEGLYLGDGYETALSVSQLFWLKDRRLHLITTSICHEPQWIQNSSSFLSEAEGWMPVFEYLECFNLTYRNERGTGAPNSAFVAFVNTFFSIIGANLRRLDMNVEDACLFPDSAKEALRRFCSANLETLSLVSHDSLMKDLNRSLPLFDSFWQEYLERCPNVRDLRMINFAIELQSLVSTLENCRTLQHLNIRGCGVYALDSQTSNEIDVTPNVLMTFLEQENGQEIEADRTNHLQILNITSSVGIQEPLLQFLLRSKVGLVEVFLEDCVSLNDNCLAILADHAPELKTLCIFSGIITDEGLTAIARGCPMLRHIDFRSHTEMIQGFSELARSCRELESVSILDNMQNCDELVTVFAQNCPRLMYMTMPLQSVVTDTALFVLAKCCPYLECLEFQEPLGRPLTEEIVDKFFEMMRTNCSTTLLCGSIENSIKVKSASLSVILRYVRDL
jgi:hypothetical protein